MTATEAQPVVSRANTITVTPMSPTIGAEITGIDLADSLSSVQRAELRQALLDWKVIFFRDQDINVEQHLRFGREFGELEIHPFTANKEGYPEVLTITHDQENPGYENVWHSDVTWRQEPSLGSILRCLQAPPLGGDTLFADMEAAYDGLPESIREQVEGAVARHDFSGFRRSMERNGATQAELDAFDRQYPNPEHPVIRTHPETGRRSIYVNAAFTLEIIGFDPEESERLLQLLYQQAATPEYQCRFRWEKNSIAFWDNRACQHYATSDYWPQVRMVERVTVIGDKPFYRSPDAPISPTGHQERFRGVVKRRAER